MRLLVLTIFTSLFSYAQSSYYYEYGQRVNLTKVSTKRSIDSSIEYYKKANGKEVGIKTKEILLKCVEGVNCRETLQGYHFVNIESLSQRIFLVTLTNEQNIFSLAQELHNNQAIEFAHPNFVKERQRR